MRRLAMSKAADRCVALASDYDGTLARDGRVDAETLAALGLKP